MTTEKQIQANRKNAQKSTGPTSPEGKATVSQNATAHGLYSTRIVVDSPTYSEDPAEYNHLLASLIWELKPDGILQNHLVHKIANALWRYKRVIRAETGHIQFGLDNLDTCHLKRYSDDPDLETEEGRAAYQDQVEHRRDVYINLHSVPSSPASLHLLRYEMRLDRQVSRAYKLLAKLQKQQAKDELEYEKKNTKK